MYEPFLKYQSGPKKGKLLPGVKIRDKDKTIIWPSGAKTRFSYLQNDRDANQWYGTELSRVYMDEFQHFSEVQFTVLRSRLRSKAKFPSAMRCTMNPDSGHFVLEFIRRYLDEEGYPIREYSGKRAWFIINKLEKAYLESDVLADGLVEVTLQLPEPISRGLAQYGRLVTACEDDAQRNESIRRVTADLNDESEQLSKALQRSPAQR